MYIMDTILNAVLVHSMFSSSLDVGLCKRRFVSHPLVGPKLECVRRFRHKDFGLLLDERYTPSFLFVPSKDHAYGSWWSLCVLPLKAYEPSLRGAPVACSDDLWII